MPNVFEQAYSAVENVDQIVTSRIMDATETAATLQAEALDTLEKLKDIQFNFSPGAAPRPPNIAPNIDISLQLPPVDPTSFGTITSQLGSAPSLENPPSISRPNIPEFQSSIGSLTIPQPPSYTAPGAPPEAPPTENVDLPAKPLLPLPVLPSLIDVTIPEFGGLALPVFNASLPEFEASALPGILQWSEPEYHPEILDEVMEKLRLLWSGSNGIPPAVEAAMVERAMSREVMIAEREIDAVSEEFSLRGFTMPTGMQAARVDQMRQDLALKNMSANRELTIEFVKIQVENVRFAVTNAIAAENVLVNIFSNMAERTFLAAKFRVESQIQIYNAQVALFNARMNAYQIQAQVFNTLVQAELAKIEIFKAEVEAELAKGQLNEQKVRTYTAQIQALQTQVEIYKAEMQGASIHSDVIRNRIEAYRASVEAYAARIQADKVHFESYEAQVRGEAAKAGIIDAEARAYAALIQGKAAAADIDVKRADIVIQKNRAMIEAYVADLEAEKARIQSQTAVIQAGAQAYIANTQRFAAQAQAETAKAQVIVSAQEASMRTNVAFYQAQVQAYLGHMEQLIRQASLVVEALKSAGQIGATLAAGSFAGVHVGATLSGAGGVNASGAYSEAYSDSKSTSTNTNYNYEGT